MRLKYHPVKAQPKAMVSFPPTEWYRIPEEWVRLECKRALTHPHILVELLTTELKLVHAGVHVSRVNRMVDLSMYYEMATLLDLPRSQVNNAALDHVIRKVEF
jgi:hypothetical protein